MQTKITVLNKSNGQGTLYIDYSRHGKHKRFATGVRVDLKLWNGSKILKGAPNSPEETDSMNAAIRQLKTRVDRIILDYQQAHGTTPDVEYVARVFEQARPVDEVVTSKSGLLEYLKEYMELRKPVVSFQTMKAYQNLYTNLKEYEAKQKSTLAFDTLDNTFLAKFTNMLLAKGKYESSKNGKDKEREPYLNTTIKKRISTLKELCSYYRRSGVNSNSAYQDFKFSAKRNEITATITKEDFQAMLALDLSANKKLAFVRDYFATLCLTGLRHSDGSRLRPHHFQETGGRYTIHITTQKTKDKIEIPVSSVALQIYKRWGFTVPSKSNQKMNDYIKDVCALVPTMQREVVLLSYSGNKAIEEKVRLCDIISTHDGRRYFCTQLLLKRIPPKMIMQLTGHRTLAQFEKYLNRTEIDADALEMALV